MGQTLENGVYLPSEGERNCYAGLKTNWEILDQKVADVTALQQAVAGALHREIVESLPTTDIDPNTIYMILSGTSATENVYNEFMYVNNAWELIGTSATDLTNYYTKGDVDGLLLLKANASDLTSHTGDTTIHVTASDKTKWTNSANTVVLRLAKTALTPSSSTNAFSNLDDATALKVGDKVMDNAGVLFEVTAIDTANSTFTIGTSLIDLAQDSDVVHKSGNETVGGIKTFSDNTLIYNSDNTATTPNLYLKSSKVEISSQGNTSGDQNLTYLDKNSTTYAYVKGAIQSNGSAVKIRTIAKDSSDNSVINELQILAYANGNKAIFPTYSNEIDLGVSNYKWKSVSATNYYYGSNNVEFSNKFVTTDTAQTVGGIKTFSSDLIIANTDTTVNTPNLFLKNSKVSKGSTSETGAQLLKFVDKNNFSVGELESIVTSQGASELRFRSNTLNSNNQNVQTGVTLISITSGAKRFCPTSDNDVFLGASTLKWSRVYSTNYYYGNDNIEFSTKFVTTDTAQTISETKTFTNTIKSQKEIEFTGNRLAYILPNFSASYSGLSLCTYGANGAVRIGIWKVDDNDNTKHVLNDSLGYLNISTGSSNSVNIVYLTPRNASKAKLGDSVNKWHEINGVEPSSLSLPSGNANDVIDISSYLTYLDGTDNTYVAPSNGWITINMNNCSGIHATIAGFWSDSRVRASAGAIKFLMPVLKNQTVTLTIHGGTINNARFIPCQGNV